MTKQSEDPCVLCRLPSHQEKRCYTVYVPENEVARILYRSLGFVENGEMDGDEIVAVLKL